MADHIHAYPTLMHTQEYPDLVDAFGNDIPEWAIWAHYEELGRWDGSGERGWKWRRWLHLRVPLTSTAGSKALQDLAEEFGVAHLD